MLHIEEKRSQIVRNQTRYIANSIDEAIVSSAYMIVNVAAVKRNGEEEEVLIQDILFNLNASMQGLSNAKAAFSKSVRLLNALGVGDRLPPPTDPDAERPLR